MKHKKRTQKEKQIRQLGKMVNLTIQGFPGKDKTTKIVNSELKGAYQALCNAYNFAHNWRR